MKFLDKDGLTYFWDKIKNRYDRVVTPQMFGAKGDGSTDDLAAFWDMTDYMIANDIHVAFIPVGDYCVSDGVAVPENCTFIGDGYDSYVHLTAHRNAGGVFFGGGNNVTIMNLRVGHIDGNTPVQMGIGHMGAIGISNGGYEELRTYQTHGEDPSQHEDRHGFHIYNIYCEDSYPIQTEIFPGYKITDIEIRNVYAPKGMISFAPKATNTFERIIVENVVCDYVRFGIGAGTINDAVLSNIKTNYIDLTSTNSSNIVFRDSRVKTASDALCTILKDEDIAMNVHVNLRMENCVVENNANLGYGIRLFYGTCQLVNCKCTGFTTKNVVNIWGQAPTTFYNCDFGTTNNTDVYGTCYNVIAKRTDGTSGNAAIYDDTTIYYNDLTLGGYTQATGSIVNRVHRIGRIAKIEACLTPPNNMISENDTVATLPGTPYYPTGNQKIMATAHETIGGNMFKVWLKVNTNGTLTVTGMYATTGNASLKKGAVLLSIDGIYLI